MKRALIVISLGISLITVGGIITAYEISSWRPYDLEENSANFPVESVKQTYDFEDLDTDTVIISNNMYVREMYDLDDLDDYYFLFDADYQDSQIKIIEDSNQVEGSFIVEMDYMSGLGAANCRLRANNRVKPERSYWGPYRNFRNSRGERYDTQEGEIENHRSSNNPTYIYPDCSTYPTNGFDTWRTLGSEGIINMLKNREIPIATNQMKIYVHPNDAHKIYK